MSETKQITIRLSADVYAAAVEAAEADRRKLATWIALAIEAVVLEEAAERD
jgi:predicted HicB family RNase H-like nuclease